MRSTSSLVHVHGSVPVVDPAALPVPASTVVRYRVVGGRLRRLQLECRLPATGIRRDDGLRRRWLVRMTPLASAPRMPRSRPTGISTPATGDHPTDE
jgi:hypothetical protein